jgi:hypothetical protein
MPKKPEHPTIYPQQTRSSAIGALASIIARAAVRSAQSEQNQRVDKPVLEQKIVHMETSVCANQNVIQLSLELD